MFFLGGQIILGPKGIIKQLPCQDPRIDLEMDSRKTAIITKKTVSG